MYNALQEAVAQYAAIQFPAKHSLLPLFIRRKYEEPGIRVSSDVVFCLAIDSHEYKSVIHKHILH